MMLNLPDEPIVAVDTEGSGLFPDDGARVSLVQIGWDGGSVAYAFGQGDPEAMWGYQDLGADAWDELMAWLAGRGLVMHNAAHDLRVLGAGAVAGHPGVDLSAVVVWDTMLAAWVLDPLERIGLDDCGERHLGMRKDTGLDDWRNSREGRRQGKLFSRAPMDVIVPYGLRDVEMTWALYRHQLARIDEGEGWAREVIDHEMDVMRTIHRMTTRGIGYDLEGGLDALETAREAEAKAKAAVPFQPVTEARARRWFFDEKGALPHCVTPKGQKSVAECCIRQLAHQGVVGAAEWAKAVKVSNSISMWYQGYLDKVGPDGRIRTDLRQTGTISMRSSSQRVNLQALPHDYRLEAVEGLPSPRSLFVPAPGMLLYELDLSQAELRHAAKAAKCETILALLRAGEDVHGSTASRLFGVTASDGTWKQYRNVAKRANFSAIFGIGAPKFNVDVEKQTGVKLGEARAGEILTAWRSLYPEFQVAMARAERLAIKRGWIKLAGGRLRWFAPYESPHKAFNQYVQGSLAQAKKRWMVEVDRELPGTLVLEVHDSLVEEVWSEAEAKRAAVIGEQVCSEFLGVPMLVDVKQWK